MLYGEYDNTGALIREYVYFNGEPLAQIDSGETLTYLHTDHLGTPRYASNTSATQVWSWLSDAFGNGSPSGTATVNLRFSGQYFDSESGLHYNWNRYYDPKTGRYISSDPIGLAGGLNTYTYVSANPVMFTDPEGLALQACVLNPVGCATILKACVDAATVIIGGFSIACNTGMLDGVVKECSNDNDKCAEKYAKVDEAIDMIKKRERQLHKNRKKLFEKFYEKGSNPNKKAGTWEGHIQQYYDAQAALKNRINEAEAARCRGWNQEALEWLDKPAPLFPLQ